MVDLRYKKIVRENVNVGRDKRGVKDMKEVVCVV